MFILQYYYFVFVDLSLNILKFMLNAEIMLNR